MMERLSIDEIIAHCERNVQRNEKTMSKEQFETNDMDSWFMKEYWEHRQVAEYLKELQAYRDAEEQGLLMRLPCPIGGTVWGWEYPTRIDEEDGSTWTICDIRRAIVVPEKFNLFMLDKMGESYFITKEEAEQALNDRKGVQN